MSGGLTRANVHQGLAFLAVGVASAVVDAGVFWVLISVGMWPVLASALSFSSAFVINYRGNRDLVFRAKASPGALWRYTALVVVNLGLSAGGVAIGTEVLRWDPLWAKIGSMVLIALVNFVVMRTWVFKRPFASPATGPGSAPE